MVKEIKEHTLYFDGCSTVELAQKYDTPLYVYSESDIVSRFAELRRDFVEKYPGSRVAYAAKAFFPLAMAEIVRNEDMCVDVVSGGELYTAIKAGFPAERIEFNGNNKLRGELEMAVEYGIGRIIVDGLSELAMIEDICRDKGKTIKILFRITPGVKSSSHDYIVTGKKDSKFGIPLDDDVIMPQIKAAIDSPYVEFYGLHFHVGSQLLDRESHLQALEVLLELAGKVQNTFGKTVKELNLGGGFGVTYVDEKRPPYSYFLDPMMERIGRWFTDRNLPQPQVVIEPGRSIVAEAGITLYTVGSIKEIRDIRKYVSVDGGMTDNIRPALYQAEYTGVIANKADMPATEKVTICGKCCESGDILIQDLPTPAPETGDIFATYSTGAYGYSMASNYNKNPIPAVVFVKKGEARLAVKRQTYDDMLRNEQI
ncbi:diaminopimelate decarboxylase [Ihubacter sp. rT4E-8]|uniref:diaminopimelate decarboxylase n=1 Tax=unclassified Ihubacter TaxID=2633299 RepID=UPI003C7BBD9E